MTGYLILQYGPDGRATPIHKRDLAEACKIALSDKTAQLFEVVENKAAADVGDHNLFDFVEKEALDPVMVQPPTPDPYLDYQVSDKK